MVKKLLLLLMILPACYLSHAQDIESPAEFLSYQLGEHFTPEYQMAAYFNYVSQHASNVKLQEYGVTNEGRPLLIAIITSPDNFSHLEEIRTNNLKLADELPGVGDTSAPAIVWLSYNVHGDEPSPSEAAMETLYNLVNPSNPDVKEWLQHVVVIIDPCLNPDGHDRYVDHYNEVADSPPDLTTYAREHHQPWPAGRFNHYYFDLNRDWVWQTQVESQARLAVFHQWLPEVHADFHEMGINDTYYFPPGAQPYHDIITPWEKQMQEIIGKNNAKHFDENGWLYFTKEVYDLFYPSYGDTYPLYNGAIGMTYEQGGGGKAGLAILNEEGDTLTLAERIQHHYTASMSTIEISALYAHELVQHFHQYYEEAVHNPAGEYKSYIIKANGNADKLKAMATLLQRNHIAFGYGVTGSVTGYNYFTGKTETTKIVPRDMVINAYQPASHLLEVLFEPRSHLVDSVTYDITAWALPYAYGAETYASIQSIKPVTDTMPLATSDPDTINGEPYAYLCRWQSTQDAKFLAAILQQGIKVRFAEDSFTINNINYAPGTLIITRTSNEMFGDKLEGIIHHLADQNNRNIDEVSTGMAQHGPDLGSANVCYLAKPHVVVMAGSGVSPTSMGEVWQFFEQQLNYPVTVVDVKDFNQINWDDVDVLVLPDGKYNFLSDSIQLAKLQSWVKKGGRLIAMNDAVQQLSETGWGLKAKADSVAGDETITSFAGLNKYSNRDRDALEDDVPGAIFKVQLDNTQPLAYGYPDYYYTLKMDDHLYDFLGDDGWNVGVIKKNALVSGFAGADAKAKLQNGLLFGVQDMDKGHVIYLADDVLFRSFWENGKLMFCNAVFMVQSN
jgi:Zinc carboxypeptidase